MAWVGKGCLGCLVIVGVLVLAGAAIVGVAWLGAHDAQATRETLSPELPPPAEDAGATEPADGTAELPPIDLSGTDLVPEGRVQLTIRHAELFVRPAPPGETISVDARYSAKTHELREELVVDDDGRWRYDVHFAGHGGAFMTALRQMFSGISPRVVVNLPQDAPLDLVLDVAQCGGQIELGGLWLREATMEASQGGFEIDISEPLREPMDSLQVATSMGGFSIASLGNASPSRLAITTRMGGAELDLTGDWSRDAEVTIDSSMGGVVVRLPSEVNITGTPSNDRQLDADAPTVHFDIQSKYGEIEVYE
jgi:hypothetical protein